MTYEEYLPQFNALNKLYKSITTTIADLVVEANDVLKLIEQLQDQYFSDTNKDKE